jgi:hypothetical protein
MENCGRHPKYNPDKVGCGSEQIMTHTDWYKVLSGHQHSGLESPAVNIFMMNKKQVLIISWQFVIFYEAVLSKLSAVGSVNFYIIWPQSACVNRA